MDDQISRLEKNPFVDWDTIPLDDLKAWLAYNEDYYRQHRTYNMGANMMDGLREHIARRASRKVIVEPIGKPTTVVLMLLASCTTVIIAIAYILSRLF